MSLQADWSAISGRISGMHKTAELLAATPKAADVVSSQYFYGRVCESLTDLLAFIQRYSGQLPKANQWLLAANSWVPSGGYKSASLDSTIILLGKLLVLQGEIAYALEDHEAASVSAVVRGLLHLQRTIEANSAARTEWQVAFGAGEVECEKLGGVHLLWHGIYAFKADGGNFKTDLVLGEHMTPDTIKHAASASTAMTLTEWKRTPDLSQQSHGVIDTAVLKACKDGLKQARDYTGQKLAGFELERNRFVIVVSTDVYFMPFSKSENDVTYHFTCIGVDPSSPSKRYAATVTL